MKFELDNNTCIGCGQCVNTCDKVFGFDDDGLVKVLKKEVTDEDLIEEATDAMNGCPVGAITEIEEK